MTEENIIFTLDNGKKYVLVNQIKLENKTYICLSQIDSDNNIFFGELKDKTIEKVIDDVLLGRLIILFGQMNQNKQ